jgi:hypothetical protein
MQDANNPNQHQEGAQGGCMQLHRLGKSLFGKAALASAALSGLFFFAGAPGAQAADRDDHDRRVTTERRFYGEDRGDNWRGDRRKVFEQRYRDYDNRRDYRSNWDRDRDYNREYSRGYNLENDRYHRDRDRD